MKWAAWENVGVDRMGCAWLIRRFIDPQSEFVFIPAGQTTIPEGYEPFDIPGVRLSHRRGPCTFHTMLREYHLDDPVLQRIASIIDEADVAQEIMLERARPVSILSAWAFVASARMMPLPLPVTISSMTRSTPSYPPK